MKQPVLYGTSGGGGSWVQTIAVKAPSGASITVSGGGETLTATGTGSYYAFSVHNQSTQYTINVSMPASVGGASAPAQTETTGTSSGVISFKEFKFATITTSVTQDYEGVAVTCVSGGTTLTIAPAVGTSSITFRVPSTGNWVISGVVSGTTYYASPNPVVISSLDDTETANLATRPDGKTVTPTDSIATWLACGGVSESYTALAEVLADHETLAILITDHNAVDYMVRSKTWATNDGLVPVMLSPSSPSGVVTQSSESSSHPAYTAFNNDPATTTNGYSSGSNNAGYLQYEFPTATLVSKIGLKATYDNAARMAGFVFKGSNDGFVSDEHTLYSGTWSGTDVKYINIENDTAYKYYKIEWDSFSAYVCIQYLQFFPFAESIPENEYAMRYIGRRNYCADTLLDDEDWADAICNSNYTSYIFDVTVPALSSDTAQIIYSTVLNSLQPFNAFDDNWTKSNAYGSAMWYSASGSNEYLGYDFGQDVSIKDVKVRGPKYTDSTRVYYQLHSCKVQYSDIGDSDPAHWTDASDVYTFEDYDIHVLVVNANAGEHRYWRLYCIDTASVPTGGGTYCGIKNLQFFGRTDVDETKIAIYGAASDSDIYYLNSGSPVNVGSTNTSGFGEISRSDLPNGTYTLYSSVAKDPSNLSNDYSKSVVVDSNTIEIMLMPDKTAYWYGNKDNTPLGCETATRIYGGSSANAPTWNTQSIHFGGSTQGAISKTPLKGSFNGKAKFVVKNNLPSGNMGLYLASSISNPLPTSALATSDWDYSYPSYISNVDTLVEITINNTKNNNEHFITSMFVNDTNRQADVKAMWYE